MTRTQTYDTYGWPATLTTQPPALAVGYDYNARGYLSKLRKGTSALVTYTAADARGNATGVSFYGNGVATTRTFDELGPPDRNRHGPDPRRRRVDDVGIAVGERQERDFRCRPDTDSDLRVPAVETDPRKTGVCRGTPLESGNTCHALSRLLKRQGPGISPRYLGFCLGPALRRVRVMVRLLGEARGRLRPEACCSGTTAGRRWGLRS